MQRALRIAGWSVAFVVLLLLCVRLTFPTGALARMLEVRMSEALGATDVKIGELSLLGLIPGGVELEEVEIVFKDVALKSDTPGKDRTVGRVLQAERVAIEASLGGLLGGEVDATFEGELMGGRLEGGRLVVPKEGMARVRIASIRDVNLGSERLFAATTGFDVHGVLSGSIDLQLPVTSPEGELKPDLSGLAGTIDLAIADTRIDAPVVERNQMRQALTDVKMGVVTVKVRVGDGKTDAAGADGDKRRKTSSANVVHLEEVSTTGPDLQMAIGQRAAITFPPGRPIAQAALRAHFAILIDEGFIGRELDDPKSPGKKLHPNGAIKLILEDLGRKGHMSEGQFGLTLSGPLSKPTITTEKPRVRAGESGGGSNRRMNVDASAEDSETEAAVSKPMPASERPNPRPAITRPAIGGGRPVLTSPLGGSSSGRPPTPQPNLPTRPGGTATMAAEPPTPPPEPEREPQPTDEEPSSGSEGQEAMPDDPGLPLDEPAQE